MKTSRKLNLISDASVRFERGIDRNIQAYGLKRFTNLYELDENIQYSEISDSSKQTESENFITFETSLIESILGQVIDNKFITSTLKSLSIESEIKKDTIKFKQPSWRYDLERPIDLIEEIAKHYGFNNFKSTEYESKSVFPKALISKLPNSYSLILISLIEAFRLRVLFDSVLFKFILFFIL